MPGCFCRLTHAVSSFPPCYVKTAKGACVPQQLSARPLSGRERRYPSSEMLVPMLPQEMMMCEVEASCELDVVGSHQKYTVCTEPGKCYSLLC